MAVLDRTATLDPIREKIEAGERLDLEDGLALMESDDILALGELADLARRRRGGGDEVYFVQNLYLNQTNVCRVKCKFCAFAVTQKQQGAYTYTAEEMVEDALQQRELSGFTEIHMVGGESPHVDFQYYVEIVRQLHEAMPDVHLKLFTASEIHHMSKLGGLTHEEVLQELRNAGLGSLPGGGAEVFADRVRRLVAPGKEHPDNWFDVHRTAHRLGIPTHCTMLYGHVETYAERVDHRIGRPEADRGLPAAARQRAEHQGLLDHDGPAADADRPAFRRERRAGDGRTGGDLPRRRRDDRARAEDRRAGPDRQGSGPRPGAARHALQRAQAVGRLTHFRHGLSLTCALPAHSLSGRGAVSGVPGSRGRACSSREQGSR
jgi:hypothetical protein